MLLLLQVHHHTPPLTPHPPPNTLPAGRPAGGVRSIGISYIYIYIHITLSVKPITGIETPRPLGKIWDSHWAVTGLSQRHCPQSMHHYLSLSLSLWAVTALRAASLPYWVASFIRRSQSFTSSAAINAMHHYHSESLSLSLSLSGLLLHSVQRHCPIGW